MPPFEQFDKTNLCVIKEDYTLVVVGYPVWRGFVAATDTDIWIEIIPAIDVINKTIILPQKKQKPKQKDPIKKEQEKQKEEIDPEVIKRFFLSIPPEIIELVSRFPDSHWELIGAVKLIGDDFQSLMKTNPALAYIIVNMEKLNPSFLYYANIELFQRMIKTKRKEILRLCGFPEAARMVKIFSKIDPKVLDIKLLVQLKDVLMTQTEMTERILQILSFAKRINKNLIHLVAVYTEVLESLNDRLVFELAEDETYSLKAAMLQQMSHKSRQWKVALPKSISLPGLDEAKKKFDEKVKVKRDKLDIFPGPPLEDNEHITAITTETKLISWAKRQQNCIRDYAGRIRNGKCYFYRVIYNNEEATLEVIKKKNKTFGISDLSGFKNCRVSDKLYSMVQEWIKTTSRAQR